jgi:hypothetical protein
MCGGRCRGVTPVVRDQDKNSQTVQSFPVRSMLSWQLPLSRLPSSKFNHLHLTSMYEYEKEWERGCDVAFGCCWQELTLALTIPWQGDTVMSAMRMRILVRFGRAEISHFEASAFKDAISQGPIIDQIRVVRRQHLHEENAPLALLHNLVQRRLVKMCLRGKKLAF